MSAQEAPPGSYPFSSDYLKVWMDQAGAVQGLFSRLLEQSAAGAAAAMPTAAPWKDFIAGLGMGQAFTGGGEFRPQDLLLGALPSLGLSREYQEVARRLAELGQRFQQRYAELTQQSASLMQDAFLILRKRIDADASLRNSTAELYDAWIECAEGCYAQVAHGDVFARLLADLCNISSAMKIERGKLLEQIARHLDLPSRAEVDSLHLKIRDLTAAMHRTPSTTKKSAARTRKRRKQSGA